MTLTLTFDLNFLAICPSYLVQHMWGEVAHVKTTKNNKDIFKYVLYTYNCKRREMFTHDFILKHLAGVKRGDLQS